MELMNDILTPDMFGRHEDLPKTRLVKYTTKCPLCDAETERVQEVPRYTDFIASTSVICDECKTIWAYMKNKYIGKDTNDTTNTED